MQITFRNNWNHVCSKMIGQPSMKTHLTEISCCQSSSKNTCGWRPVVPTPLGLGLSLSVIISLRVDRGHRGGAFPSTVGLTRIWRFGFAAVNFALLLLPWRFKQNVLVRNSSATSAFAKALKDFCIPILGDEFASCRPSAPMPAELWMETPPWCSSCLSSKFPIKALRIMSSRPRLLAGSPKEGFLGLMLPTKTSPTMWLELIDQALTA